MRAEAAPVWIALGRDSDGFIDAVCLTGEAEEIERVRVESADIATWISDRERQHHPRWVWSDTPQWYASVVSLGHTVTRCHDLRLVHALLRDSSLVLPDSSLKSRTAWDARPPEALEQDALFSLLSGDEAQLPTAVSDVLQEFERQRAAIATSRDPKRLRLLAAAESAGALVAVELRAAGVPWDVPTHEAILTEALGARPTAGGQPRKMEDAARRTRDALGDPAASLDSAPKLLRSLHRVGISATSTSRWELAEHDHPAIAPLLEYKKLARLHSANGWAWLEEWIAEGRFRPVYVPSGVVTGRWASSGGGALQLPRQLRAAVRADPGWKLVAADVAQLEPRVLAGMAQDRALTDAAHGRDLYAGIVGSGGAATRDEAKIAILGAMYGATTGESGRLVPRLRRIFPRAMALVDEAARVGEEGGIVTTWLGRSCPVPSPNWMATQARASHPDADTGDETRARREARDRGRFTRNFVVQGTAAEWALAWLADLRLRLAELNAPEGTPSASRSGPAFERRPHLAFFLHDEVLVHTPEALADRVAQAVQESASAAGRLLFQDFPIDFPLSLRISDSADKE